MLRLFSCLLAAGTAAALTLAPCARAAAQQNTGSIAGRVTELESQRPIPEAQIAIVGTTRGARTDVDGRYRITGVPAGTVTLRVARIGFQSTTRQVAVAGAQESTADFGLGSVATVLSAITTTASGTQQLARENGASVAQISTDTIVLAPVQNFSELVTARASGVTISQSTGTTGEGARIRIRGANSMSLSNEPLIIIDGVRIDNTPESNSIGVGGQSPSRLNDINPEDIESFEIVKGPAAAALYGTAAANGVIQITTKRGRAGQAKWDAYGELGSIYENNAYPPNYGGWTNQPLYGFPGWPKSRTPSPTCNLVDQSFGNCTIDSLSTFDPLEQNSPFRVGRRQKFGGSVSGGVPASTYFISADAEQEGGVYTTSNLAKLNLRGNLSAHPNDKIDVNVSSGFLRSQLQLPQNDNNYYGAISNGLAGWPGNGPTDGYNPVPPAQFDNIDTRQDVNRFTGGANAAWRPLSWLSSNATLGLDVVNRLDEQTIPPNTVFFSNDNLGSRTSNRFQILNITTNYSLTGRYHILSTLEGVTQAGYQYQQAQDQGTEAFGRTLTAGSGSLGGTVSDKTVDEATVDNKTVGGFVSQQLSWNEKLYVSLALRGDKNSAFGKNFGFIQYPSASASYVVTEGGTTLNQLRLRTAYGESGLRPGVLDAIAYFTAAPARLDSTNVAGVTSGNLGNPNLKAERTREYEVGFDAGFFHDRASIGFTYYDKRSRDALVLVPLAQSFGGPTSEFQNLGAVTNSGVELTLNATPLQRNDAVLALTLTASGNRNRVTNLGGQPPILFGYSQRHVQGYPLGGYWGTTVDSVKVSPDGSISPNDVFFTTDPDKYRFLGSVLPTRQGSILGDLTLFKFVRLSTLFEYRGGNKLYNSSEQFRCLPFVLVCRGLNDKSAPVMERANAIADYMSNGDYFGGYIEDAGFVKWRELSLTLNAPARYAQKARASALSITFAGRNLGTWTKYSGVDPEVNVLGQDNNGVGDFLTQPQVRYFITRLNLTF
ncbi:MAG TPA: SusC/RagA family TonB-linked outer membrane protein [Gemmatimonadaceae bacterium]|jgi:TonB-linked SusC/RagA family outer membrane protein